LLLISGIYLFPLASETGLSPGAISTSVPIPSLVSQFILNHGIKINPIDNLNINDTVPTSGYVNELPKNMN
jgi:hypothetical protein